jgi:hypothetical protein
MAFVIYRGTPPLDLVGSWQFLGALAMNGSFDSIAVVAG